jgi:hypothetical protein
VGNPTFDSYLAQAEGREPSPMAPDLPQLIRQRLIDDFGFVRKDDGFKFGLCPGCGRKTLAPLPTVPLHIHCSRSTKCGWDSTAPELYPDLYERFTERHPATAAPDATAAQYLHLRYGLSPADSAGHFAQGTYWHPKGRHGTATVRFRIGEGSHYDHLIDPVPVGDKLVTSDLAGEWRGHWWTPSDDLVPAEAVWLVVSPVEALALHLAGIAAAAILSADEYPSAALLALAQGCMAKGRPDLVWALGPDSKALYKQGKWIARAKAEGWPCRAALPEEKPGRLDWLGLSLRRKLTAEHTADYLHYGALHIAPSAAEKARLMYRREPVNAFPLDHGRRLWWFTLDAEKFEKEEKRLKDEDGLDEDKATMEALKAAGSVSEICDCLPEVLYYQANPITDDYWYYLRVEFPHGGAPVKAAFTAAQLREAGDFKKRLFAIAPGALWTGKPGQLDRLLKQWTYGIKTVKTIDYVGYAKEHAAWIFGEVAIRDGKVYRLNEEDFFDLGRLSVKSLERSVHLDINADPDQFSTEWVSLLWTAFGPSGLMVLAFWFLSLFAEQIYARLKFFPFLEVTGEPGSGKSTVVELCWKLFGRIHEGFDASTANQAALARNFNQVSNIPVALIESDRTKDHQTGRPRASFDWDSLKKLYNRRGFKSRGMRTQGNETYEPPFKGTLAIIQNHPIQADKAVLERLIAVPFCKTGHNDTTRNAVRKLETMPMAQLSGFIVRACLAEQDVLKAVFEGLAKWEPHIANDPTIKTHRIVMHYALMMAGVEALAKVLPITEEQISDTRDALFTLAVKRQQSLSQDHPVLAQFWELFRDLEDSSVWPVLNHSKNQDFIAINLTDYMAIISKRGLHQAPSATDLRQLFPDSTTHQFVGNKVVESAIRERHNADVGEAHKLPRSVRCWVFKR